MFVKEAKSGTRGTKIFLLCDVCGKGYTSPASRYRSKKTKGDYCSSECRAKSKQMFLTCVNCGKAYTRYKSSYARKESTCCSRECQFEQQKKGGVISKKTVITNLKRYGVERPAQCEEVIEKYRDNEAWQCSLFEKGNIPWNNGLVYSDEPELQKITDKMMANHPSQDQRREEWIKKIRESARRNYAAGNRVSGFVLWDDAQRQEHIQRLALSNKTTRPTGGLFVDKRGKSHRYDSTWEHDRMTELDKLIDVVAWSRCKDSIPYFFDERNRKYYPDFVVEYTDGNTVVEEIKGIITEQTLAKFDAAKKFYDELDIKFTLLTRLPNQKGWVKLDRSNIVLKSRGKDFSSVLQWS